MKLEYLPETDHYDLQSEEDALQELFGDNDKRYVKALVEAFKDQLSYVTMTVKPRANQRLPSAISGPGRPPGKARESWGQRKENP